MARHPNVPTHWVPARIASLALLAALLLAPAALAVDQVVHPTGTYPADVENVQAAADLGGTILLTATNAAGEPTAFNFGTPALLPDRGVFLENEVTVLGERASGARTTIRGG